LGTLPSATAVPGHGDQFNTIPMEVPTGSLPEKPTVSDDELRQQAAVMAAGWQTVPAQSADAAGLPQRLKTLTAKLESTLQAAKDRVSGKDLTPQLELLESGRMLEAAINSTDSAASALVALPQIHVAPEGALPRVANLAETYLAAAQGIWSNDSLTVFVAEAQKRTPLLLAEILLLPQALKLAQLEYVLDRAQEAFAAGPLPPIEQSPFSGPIHSMRRLNQHEWRSLLESMIPFDPVLREDPANAFGGMEDETRNSYHMRVAELASHADFNELETARAAIDLAKRAQQAGDPDPRRAERLQHVGYYLFKEGLPALKRAIGYHPPLSARPRELLLRYNEEFYVFGINLLSVLLIVVIVAPLVPRNEFWPVMIAMLLVLIPVTQGAVDLINGIVHSMLKAESLPKMDYAKGVPVEATTLVVVPTLLLREDQVQELFEDLEARYLSNEDANIHFALLTDLPDSATQPQPDEQHPLVQMAVRWTENLNEKYAGGRGGAFLLLHRHRVYNVRQGVWMGWERKRGKLLDLNKLLLNEYDSFPVKSGPLSVIGNVRFVITLDSDTKLPRSTAARMIGTMIHPLNRAIISPQRRIVTAGYGILQPRVGVSVSSASRSRLAAIYSGETGFDIYTRAVSDVYQDLFGEGIFTGKGIYEVSVLHQVLERRFPRDSLLSHDLIEGAYVRAGLVTDIEIIDDYPSQYEAHTRRKHRWIRGDWQIMRWLFGRVPDESSHLVNNPISLISKWKIFDNLRRSLVEPVTFLVLILGWFVFPGGAVYWTVITVTLLLLPALVQFAFDLAGALAKLSFTAVKTATGTFSGSFAFAFINLTFLAHHTMLALDAIVRSLNRTLFSGRHLLQWETAAQAETSRKRTWLDIYLTLSPAIAILLGSSLALLHRHALRAAAPVLFLWCVSPLVARWLNSSPTRAEEALSKSDRTFLEQQALYLWRFYADFGGAENYWLIPDNVEEKDMLQVRKLSPTNLGMLLNARQAACELGFLTLPEFVQATLGTLTTYERLEKQRGHIFNWYDIETLRPVPPFTISAVDSGNLAASLYTLHAGSLDLLKRPLLGANAFTILDLLAGTTASGSEATSSLSSRIRLLLQPTTVRTGKARDRWTNDPWVEEETARRHDALISFVDNYLPWLRPEFEQLNELDTLKPARVPSLEAAVAYVHCLSESIAKVGPASPLHVAAQELQARLPAALDRLTKLEAELKTIIDQSEHFAEVMEYGFLFVEARQLLSIGYDGSTHELHSACYDLLASEARIASFLAVAKGDIPQQAWFRLDRSHVLVNGRAALVSWTGTMFEYMMPALWMRTFPNTLLANSLESAVRIQYEHVRKIPWGISESGFATTDPQGRYGYQAWGIPKLALKYGAEDGPVISPYSTFLALPLLRRESLANLRRMAAMGWTGAYGFYEAADYTVPATSAMGSTGKAERKTRRITEPRLVRSWMAHHQGMSLLAVTNLLRENIFQTWFHANPRVRAAELLLNERALSKQTLNDLQKRSARETA
jgi:cyclic beta-1,2-glucan synthetase